MTAVLVREQFPALVANPGIVYSREAAGLRRRIAASGARSGGRDNSAGRGLLAALTRREQQVASLVSQGLTNRRMAQRPHVTEYDRDAPVEHLRKA
jgi:DNA-binding NarL/FixJ family response regulator